MKIKSIAMLILAAIAMPLVAMPTKQELKQVEGLVQELMRPELDAFKTGKKTRADVAKSAISLAEKAESDAAKILLLKGSFTLYVGHGAFDEAIGVLKTLKTTIPDIPPEYMANMIESALRNVPKRKGGLIYRLLDETKAYMRHQDELKNALAKSKKQPSDRTLHLRIAELYAILGDWDKALDEFTKGDNPKAAEAAKAEKGEGKMSKNAIAEFWWSYPANGDGEQQKKFKRHAAAIYTEAITSGDASGLVKIKAQRRIDEVKGYGEDMLAGVVVTNGTKNGKVQLWEGGPYWAEMNIGAKKPEDYGYYFWWGDTVGYKRENDAWVASDGSSSNFSFEKKNAPTFEKTQQWLQDEGWITVDGVLTPQHDAAHVQWGGGWRMPTIQELSGLTNKCDWTWTTQNGVKGYVVRGRGDYASNSIFLPAAGLGHGTSLGRSGSYGYYWSSVPNSVNYNYASYLYFYSGRRNTYSYYRYDGFSVRPVQGLAK